MAMHYPTPSAAKTSSRSRPWIFDLLFIFVLLLGAYLRFSGIDWGENSFMHPDERFLLGVGSGIEPVSSLSEYFDTPNSPLNPHNRGYGFYVYGTLPMFLARYLVEWSYGMSGYVEMLTIGRPLSAFMDLMTVLVVYAIGRRLYDRRVALLSAAFLAFAVLHIQQSHFFTMDTFITFFTLLAVYFAVRVMQARPVALPQPVQEPEEPVAVEEEQTGEVEGVRLQSFAPFADAGLRIPGWLRRFVTDPLFWISIGFGAALGMAVASKLNAAPVAFVLPFAAVIYVLGLPPDQRSERAYQVFSYLVLAAVVSILTFRIFQPYAFSGPGFFGMLPNPNWVANIREQRIQAAGDVDFPPALQWARRPVWFSLQNMVLWGMGIPFGVLAWAGFLWVGWRILKGEWRTHLLLWGWTAFYFTWQSMQFNPTMRYQLPIYPTLAIFAGWAIVALYDLGRRPANARIQPHPRWSRLLAVFIGGLALAATLAWAFAFSRIYVNPFTRVEASRWIYQNIPGPINLRIDTGEGNFNQIVAFPYNYSLLPAQPYRTVFTPRQSGVMHELYLAHIVEYSSTAQPAILSLTISALPDGEQPLGNSILTVTSGGAYSFQLDQPVLLANQGEYYLTLHTLSEPVDICGPMQLNIESMDGRIAQNLPEPQQCVVDGQHAYSARFTAQSAGLLSQVFFTAARELTQPADMKTVEVAVYRPGQVQPAATASVRDTFEKQDSMQGGYTFVLDQPVTVTEGEPFELLITLTEGDGLLQILGTAIANEGDWDDGLPLRIDTYDGYGGIYRPDMGFNMYWDDNRDKLERFLRIINESEYITISSSRQWGSLPRIPERFPMVTEYYRSLVGCPLDRTIEWCYNVAQPGMFQGSLGFELVQVFEADISLGPVRINTQPSEEAFTVYDHPKVFIFRKVESYDPQQVRDILGSVEFDKVIHITPKKAGSNPADLMLPTPRLVEQQQGGTWSEIFKVEALHNRFQVLGVVVWYLALFGLGLAVYPLVRLALPGLPDHGYPLARTAGLVLLAFVVWIAGSVRIPFTRTTITAAFLLLLLVSAGLAFWQRADLLREWRTRRRYYLVIEGLMLAFFVAALLVRLGNPDLWHPWKGGEKPMDFAYFNAILKSTSFPPYDPWYSGGYLNYYYYGFVLVGVFTKWLGFIPSFAYNLILPSVFMLIAMGAFSAAWNLNAQRGYAANKAVPRWSLITGLVAAAFMAVLGNLGTVRMIVWGYQRLAAPGGVIEDADLLTRIVWGFQGFFSTLSGAKLPYPLADWYWVPSRVMPPQDNAITEFPYFTFLYGDPHAHLFALPVALLALSFAISVVLSRGRWRGVLGTAAGFFVGAMVIGALYPINLSDIYTYLPLGLAAVGYTTWRFYDSTDARWLPGLPALSRRVLVTVGSVAVLAVLSRAFYSFYSTWYAQGYSSVEIWKGIRTPSTSYVVHWGLFLFVIATWLAWETRDWMAKTPLSALRRLEPYKGLIQGLAGLLLMVVIGFLLLKVYIIWIALPLAAWAGVLLLRPRLPETKRIALFLMGTGLLITIMVELVAVRGDIGRMNTVFKFYLQAWTLFAVAGAAAVGWLLSGMHAWSQRWRLAWQVPFVILVASSALFTLMGTVARVRDRMVTDVPLTLDGMDYMQYAHQYDNLGTLMDLNQDYYGIRWMQENVPGSPVIVEAASPNQYFWFARYANYTGLPTVLGWQWHQMQQRILLPGHWVPNRLSDVNDFYQTADLDVTVNFLQKYDVQYIILGQVERGYYAGFGLEKFETMDGQLWNEVYRDRDTVIYKVIR